MTKGLLAIAVTLLIIAVTLPGTVEAQTPPPHKDPKAEAAEFNPLSILEYFSAVVGLLAQGNYGNAQNLPEQLQHANIPEDLRFIIERYGELLGNLRNELDFTESSLREASVSLDRGDYPAARQQLEAAGSSLENAKRLLEDLQLSTETVARRLGVFGTPASAHLRKAYEQLQALLTRLDDLWARYAATLEQLEAAVEAVETSAGGGAAPEPPPIY
jgi:tetratricopeptide (TPR) repeat protein